SVRVKYRPSRSVDLRTRDEFPSGLSTMALARARQTRALSAAFVEPLSPSSDSKKSAASPSAALARTPTVSPFRRAGSSSRLFSTAVSGMVWLPVATGRWARRRGFIESDGDLEAL